MEITNPLEDERIMEDRVGAKSSVDSISNDTLKSSTSEDFSYYDIAQIAEMRKKAQITELIGLMEETHKNRNWLIDRIRKKRQKVQLKPDMGPVGILKACEEDFIVHLIGVLKNDKLEGFDAPPATLSRTYHWFYTDIVASSNPLLTTDEQARKIFVLNKIIEITDTFKQRDSNSTLILPTGDGVAIGFDDSPEKPLKLAMEIHEALYTYNKTRRFEKDRILIRIGLDTGPVFMIKDLNGKDNVWGPGVITARRIMDLAREKNILASARFANDVRMLRPEYKDILHPIGDFQIKHGEKVLIYNIFDNGFGNPKPPRIEKQKSIAAEGLRTTNARFVFNYISVELQVREQASMMTHHTWLWNIINVSNEEVERIFYFLDGDVSRAFQDLNLTVKDEDDRELELMSLNVNKATHKEFFMKLRRPIKPGEKGRITKLEYDWEEPERHFLYRFASDCKKFDYLLRVPERMEINPKVVVVDPDIGEKEHASRPPTMKFLEDRTEVSWSGSNIPAKQVYRFDW